MDRVLGEKEWELARVMVDGAGADSRRDLGVRTVQALRGSRQFKRAYWQTKLWELRDVFPDAYEVFKEDDIRDKVQRVSARAEGCLTTKVEKELRSQVWAAQPSLVLAFPSA